MKTNETSLNACIAAGARPVIRTWEGAHLVTRYDAETGRAHATHPVTGAATWFSLSEHEVLRDNRLGGGDAPAYAFGETA